MNRDAQRLAARKELARRELARRQTLANDAPERGNPHPISEGDPLGDFLKGSTANQAYSVGKAAGNTLDFDDEIGAGMNAALGGGRGDSLGERFHNKRRELEVGKRYLANKHPVAYTGGQLAGGLGLGATKGASMVNSTRQAMATGGALTGVQSIGDGRSGHRTENLAQDVLIGTATAGILDKGATALARRAAKKAIPGIQTSKEIKKQASKLYDVMDQSGVSFRGDAYRSELNNLAGKMTSKGFDRGTNSHPKLNSIVDQMIDAQNYGLSIRDLERFRQGAVGVIRDNPDKGDTRRLAGNIVSAIDKMIGKQSNWTAQNTQALGALKEARRLWKKAVKADLIEEAIYKAGNAASGKQKGLENEFRKILNKRYLRETFTKAEIESMERIVNGSLTRNALKEVGKAGFKLNSGNNMIGGSIATATGAGLGATMGPLGIAAGIAGPNIAASAARRGALGMTNNGIKQLTNTVNAGGRLPPLMLPNYPISPLIGAGATQTPATRQR